MRVLHNFKANRFYHLISRIAHSAFFLADEERKRFVEQLWRVQSLTLSYTCRGVRMGTMWEPC